MSANVLEHSMITLFVIFLSDVFLGGGIVYNIDEDQINKDFGRTSLAMSFCFDIVDSV